MNTMDGEAVQAAATLLGQPVRGLHGLAGGRNSRVYRVDDAHGRRYALKVYYQQDGGSRDRRAAEFAGLDFLRRRGVRCVPEPLATDQKLGASLFHFIEGTPALAETASNRDMDSLVDFLVDLKGLAAAEEAGAIPPASEAVFSLHDQVDSINSRLDRLRAVEGSTPGYRQLADFLEEFSRERDQTVAWSTRQLGQAGYDPAETLPAASRTLSPSDFGFHNALRTPEGGLAFVDFEHFGWDDPAKMICDFLLHPGMGLPISSRGRFLQHILSRWQVPSDLAARVRIAYPLYGLKWCMILLNEFLPDSWQRRRFANPGLCLDERHQRQLGKAREMLGRAQQARISFPYEEGT